MDIFRKCNKCLVKLWPRNLQIFSIEMCLHKISKKYVFNCSNIYRKILNEGLTHKQNPILAVEFIISKFPLVMKLFLNCKKVNISFYVHNGYLSFFKPHCEFFAHFRLCGQVFKLFLIILQNKTYICSIQYASTMPFGKLSPPAMSTTWFMIKHKKTV